MNIKYDYLDYAYFIVMVILVLLVTIIPTLLCVVIWLTLYAVL